MIYWGRRGTCCSQFLTKSKTAKNQQGQLHKIYKTSETLARNPSRDYVTSTFTCPKIMVNLPKAGEQADICPPSAMIQQMPTPLQPLGGWRWLCQSCPQWFPQRTWTVCLWPLMGLPTSILAATLPLRLSKGFPRIRERASLGSPTKNTSTGGNVLTLGNAAKSHAEHAWARRLFCAKAAVQHKITSCWPVALNSVAAGSALKRFETKITERRNSRGTSQDLSSFETKDTIVKNLLRNFPTTFVAVTCRRDWGATSDEH